MHINPKKPSFPAERVEQFVHSLVDPTVKDSVIKRRARAGTETITKSFHDNCIKVNAQFRHDAGLKCYIVRIGTKCCEWCTEVAGKYKFGEQPDGIFRRHDNCDCTIIYDGQVLRGKQNSDGSRSKTWEELPNANAADYTTPTLSEAEGRAIEQRNLSQIRGLTSGKNGGKIRTGESFRKIGDDPMFEVTGRAIDSNPNEVEEMISKLTDWGVSINYGSNTLGYGCIRNGQPGAMSITDEASYSAWCHEFDHALKDKEAGWNGVTVLWFDPAEREYREKSAYDIEIKLAREAKREDIVKRLEANRDAEIEKIWNDYYERFGYPD